MSTMSAVTAMPTISDQKIPSAEMSDRVRLMRFVRYTTAANKIAAIPAVTASPRYMAAMMPPSEESRTNNEPMTDATTASEPMTSGNRMICSLPVNNSDPKSMTEMAETTYVSKRSAAIPAQSPTLSPTRSATTPALRGSSSGMPASTLPTMSVPTSAPLVKMPPPRRAKTEISDAPNPNPMSAETSCAHQ